MSLSSKQTEETKMKTSALIRIEKRALTFMIFVFMLALTLLVSCNTDEEAALEAEAQDSETVQLESLEEGYGDDADDLATDVMMDDELMSGGRSTSNDSRLACATITRTGDKNAGTLTIDFGAGCTDKKGNVRRGAIVLEYQGRWSTPGSFWRLSFEDYFINDISVEGTRLVTNVSESEDGVQAFTVVLEDGVITFPDGSIARRKVHRRRELERDQNNILNRLIIYGTAQGNHRNGRGYYIEILERLIYDRTCEDVIIPVSGKKLIKHGNREITVDYGDGTCDNTVTITNKNGRTWRYTVGD